MSGEMDKVTVMVYMYVYIVPVELRSALADSLDRLRSAKKCAGKTDFRTSFNAREQDSVS